MVLAKALVDAENAAGTNYDAEKGHVLPQIPLYKAREIMTRRISSRHDHINLFMIDAQAMVRADSVPMQNAFREICGAEGFEKHLAETLERISAIESLGRTREVVAKDLVGGRYRIRGKLDGKDGVIVDMRSEESGDG